jgi:hypothetical protein
MRRWEASRIKPLKWSVLYDTAHWEPKNLKILTLILTNEGHTTLKLTCSKSHNVRKNWKIAHPKGFFLVFNFASEFSLETHFLSPFQGRGEGGLCDEIGFCFGAMLWMSHWGRGKWMWVICGSRLVNSLWWSQLNKKFNCTLGTDRKLASLDGSDISHVNVKQKLTFSREKDRKNLR